MKTKKLSGIVQYPKHNTEVSQDAQWVHSTQIQHHQYQPCCYSCVIIAFLPLNFFLFPALAGLVTSEHMRKDRSSVCAIVWLEGKAPEIARKLRLFQHVWLWGVAAAGCTENLRSSSITRALAIQVLIFPFLFPLCTAAATALVPSPGEVFSHGHLFATSFQTTPWRGVTPKLRCRGSVLLSAFHLLCCLDSSCKEGSATYIKFVILDLW